MTHSRLYKLLLQSEKEIGIKLKGWQIWHSTTTLSVVKRLLSTPLKYYIIRQSSQCSV